ncbi:ATPAse AAA+ type core protein [Apiospora marii]|uniref:ATPAse AAA+ type core protein n=1 Tax=Apiospora marii TaxID=335849 RepID=A0ABR1R768_9PEZI
MLCQMGIDQHKAGTQTDGKSHHSDDNDSTSESSIEGSDANGDDETGELTGIGRRVKKKDGKYHVIDEAKWDPYPSSGPEGFDIIIDRPKGKDIFTTTSPLLLKAFDAALKKAGYPYITKSDDSIAFKEPFVPLYFSYDKVVAAATAELERSPDAFDPKSLARMQSWYEKHVLASHAKLRETLKTGWVTFEDLWALFQPGELVYCTDNFKQPRLYVIAATAERNNIPDELDLPPLPMLGSLRKRRFIVDLWFVDWDTSFQVFKRYKETRKIQSFNGSRRVTDLEFYPVQFFNDGDQRSIDDLLTKLRQRGQLWKKLASEDPASMYHSGPAIEFRNDASALELGTDKVENRNMNARVVIDHSGWTQFRGNGVLRRLTTMMEFYTSANEEREAPVSVAGLEDVQGVPDSAPKSEPFTDFQAQLCPSDLYCCLTRTTVWYSVTIASLTPVQWQKDAIDGLVIAHDTKQTLCDLVEEHKRGSFAGSLSDFIANKGQALVLVLHGPPGVGKTLTAEAIAEYTERPLFSVNIGELSKEKEVVVRLERIFELAVRWDAVLLIDEADVVLEKRSYENLKRNAIVSVFLRMLEYYRGILFLTTNRLGSMDVAFQSRVSLAVRFNALTADLRRQIWLNFLARLDPVEVQAREELLARLDDIQQWDLNGRQIRNILRMAQSVALAREKRRGAMRFAHVEQIVNETLRFQDYFEEDYRESRWKLEEIEKGRKFQQKRSLARR